MAGTLKVTMRIDGARSLLATMNKLPAVANAELRIESFGLALELADKARENARSEGRQAALLAATVRAVRDRVPVVRAGGSTRVGHAWPTRGKGKAFELLFGSEFGGHGHGFRPHADHWFFRTVDEERSEIAAAWTRAVDRIIAVYSAGGIDRGTAA